MARSILLGINSVAVEHGWNLTVHRHLDLPAMARDWRPDAMILTFDVPANVDLRSLTRFPVTVACDFSAQGIPAVDIDDQAVGRMAANHFLERSFPHLAAFGYWNTRWAVARAVAFAAEAESHGRSAILVDTPPGQSPVFHANANVTMDSIKAFLKGLPKPVGLFAACDNWGTMLVSLARWLGFRVPEDIAVLSVDNDETLCETCCPPLSSIIIPWSAMGRQAAEYVLGHMAGQTPPLLTRTQPLGVITRRSTDIYAVNDPVVHQVLSLIHAHAAAPLSVADILRQIPICQHTLERRFKAKVGRRILDEIRRAHVEQAKRLLIGTSLPTADVARLSGFPSAAKLSIAFHRETGRTPTDYRAECRLRQVAPAPENPRKPCPICDGTPRTGGDAKR